MKRFAHARTALGSLPKLCFAFSLLVLGSNTYSPCCTDAAETTSAELIADKKTDTIPAVELQLKSITLHAAGKGWFEYHGTINGPGVYSVSVGEFELNEALRVSRLNDSAGAGEIRMASPRDPVIPEVQLPSIRTLGDLLVSMKGRRVVATEHTGKSLNGVLIAVEQRQAIEGEQRYEREMVTILTDSGLQSTWLDDFQSIEPLDETFRKRLKEALRKQSQPAELRTDEVEFVFEDGPEREVSIGVMRSVPMWKVSYRVEGDKLIHRSIVDNTSGEDWSGVSLNLIDGSPVLFSMDMRSIARTQFNQLARPTRRVAMAPEFNETLGRVSGVDQESTVGKISRRVRRSNAPSAGMDDMMMGMDMDMGMGMGGGGGMGGMGGGSFGASRGRSSTEEDFGFVPEESWDSLSRAMSETSNAPAGSTLELQFEDVDLENGNTALLDTLVQPVSIEDVSVYRQSYHPTATLLCLEMENQTPALLPSGPLSVMAGEAMRSILGEVVLPDLGPASKRLVGYAMDGGVRVTPHPTENSTTVQSIQLDSKLHRLTIETLHQRETRYDILNRSGDDRTVLLESPETPQPYKMVAMDDDSVTVENADKWTRFRFDLANGQSRKLVIREQHTQKDPQRWHEVSLDRLQAWIAENKWNEEQTTTLRHIVEQRKKLMEIERELEGLLELRNQLKDEVERVSNQLTRQRGASAFPREVLARYQNELIKLENRLTQCEQRMQMKAKERWQFVDALGMDRQLPANLSALRSAAVNAEWMLGEAPSIGEDDDEDNATTRDTRRSNDSSNDDPFGGDPFGN
ncbi:hypothetical protein LOC71_12710 [Rhodopirellula sp. JC740]|uniref:Secreted protein n=1 Tax=Rhodopirellula halodulae TaxID=2894198 RepID=A0ABS8NHV3_9BACT|nr:hypothetical protein [Rhodopirellula sp. JC740]MCC9643139.1 hypothetical protein [Rhodopirellula sp. JC740]